MRKTLLILAVIFGAGCQTASEPVAHDIHEQAFQPGAAALVYTPPVAMNHNDLDLSREGRGLYALGGVETTIIDTTYVYQDDRQRYDQWGDWSRFERRSVSTSVTVRQR
jgi:hypothetical protein